MHFMNDALERYVVQVMQRSGDLTVMISDVWEHIFLKLCICNLCSWYILWRMPS